MGEKQNSNIQELYLEPEKESIVNAERVAELSLALQKHAYIIKYAFGEKETLVSKLKKLGCNDVKTLDFANCIAASLSTFQLKAIKTLACILLIEKDYDYRYLGYPTQNRELLTCLAGGIPCIKSSEEVRLALFDTGELYLPIDGTVNFVNNIAEVENIHGTEMVGIVSSVITDTENIVAKPCVYSVIVADYRGLAKTSAIMEALNWAIHNGIKIVSMSFGDYHKSVLLEEMIKNASKYGIIMVAAAGNDGKFKDEFRIMYPAAFTNVLAVGAKNGDAVADYSNGGIGADCFADGTQILKDVNGNRVSVVGTSGAAAFVAGTILKKWCIDPDKSASDVVKCIKTEMRIVSGEEADSLLANTVQHDILKETDKSIASVTGVNTITEASDAISVWQVGDEGDSDCFSDDMASAIRLPFISWTRGSIDCPGEEVWYKFTANAGGVHPNEIPGWYTVHTRGTLDTVGFLYDSNGNQIAYCDDYSGGFNFCFWVQLDFCETYYICVKAYGDNTGDFDIRVSYWDDDYGNTLETATQVTGVGYEDKSLTGHLHNEGDVDYYTFSPVRNCVIEIYTEGDTDTYGQLYCESGSLLYADNNSNGNGNFKITAHLEGLNWYYVAVSHNFAAGYGDYTLRFKLVKDYCN